MKGHLTQGAMAMSTLMDDNLSSLAMEGRTMGIPATRQSLPHTYQGAGKSVADSIGSTTVKRYINGPFWRILTSFYTDFADGHTARLEL